MTSLGRVATNRSLVYWPSAPLHAESHLRKCRRTHDGTVTFFAYDAKGRETERATFPSSYATATTRPALSNASKVTSTRWHTSFNLPTTVAEPNKHTTRSYNAKGMLTGESWTATTDATGAAKFTALKTGSTYATGWGYNANSLATSIVTRETAAGATTAVETGRWTLTYLANGSVNKLTDAISGTSATLTSDSSGLITKIAASNGAQATFTGNLRGHMVKAVTPALTTDYSIDALGLTNEIRFSDGRWIRYSYNAARRLIRITDNTGQTEQYAGLDASWFKDGQTIRTAAVWLSARGNKLLSLLVPEAKAQGAIVLIPAGILVGLILIIESGRRNSAAASSGASCCGQDDVPGAQSNDESTASRWMRQITTLLSGQSSPAQSTPAPLYDKAGLLISPKACIKAPGYCDPNDHGNLQDEVDRTCGQPRRCVQGMSRSDLLTSIERFRACGVARDKINKKCFAGGDKVHRDQAIGQWEGLANCESILGRTP
jgi:YD repeat-containing protein